MLRVLDPGVRPEELTWPMRGAVAARDRERRTVGLFEGPWAEDLFRDKNPGVALARTL
jgi:hypothetical protein